MAKSKFNYTKYLFILVLILLFLYFMSQKESDEGAVVENMSTWGVVGIVASVAILLPVVLCGVSANLLGKDCFGENS